MIGPKIILGTAQFGLDYGISNESGQPSYSNVLEILDYAAIKGITTLDTADAYGSASEIIGKYNKTASKKFLVNSKFIHSELALSEQLKISLNRLHVDHINVYHFHNYTDFILSPSIYDELYKLKVDGHISKVGLSVYDNKELLTAIGSEVVDVIQFPFNLLDNCSQRGDLMRQAKEENKELHIRSIFLQGLIFIPPNKLPSELKPLKPYLQILNKYSEDFNLPIDQIALLYALQQSDIDHIIVGIDNIEQLKRNLDFVVTNIPKKLINSINQIIVKETELLYPKNWT